MLALENGWSEERIWAAEDCPVSSELRDLKNLLAKPKPVAEVRKRQSRPKLEALEGRAFKKHRDAQVAALLARYHECGLIPNVTSVPVAWSARLNKTAGTTLLTRQLDVRSARIELASKVVDRTARLECTLAHEMCHAMAWLEDGVSRPPHGDAFRHWAWRFEQALPGVKISTCHNYEIDYKYAWECQGCGQRIQRHSKSFDTERHLCGSCGKSFVRVK